MNIKDIWQRALNAEQQAADTSRMRQAGPIALPCGCRVYKPEHRMSCRCGKSAAFRLIREDGSIGYHWRLLNNAEPVDAEEREAGQEE